MTKPIVTFDKSLIAPCGINCGTCIAYIRDRNKCPGCLAPSENKPITRFYCKIKNCENLEKTNSKYCYECISFPCQRLKHIDKRYRIRYHTSLIQNLVAIKKKGMEDYLANEITRWSCPQCGSVFSVHKDNCLNCNLDLNKNGLL
jgi:hypothetical protein